MKYSKEIKVGLIVIGGIFLLIYGLNFLKGKDLFTNRTHFHVLYNNVGGLTESNPVYYHGLVIGRVNDISIQEKSGLLLVEIALKENDLRIPSDSKAIIFSDGLLGTKAINLEFGTSTSYAQNGDTLTADLQSSLTEEMSKQVLPIKEKTEKLIGTVDTLIQSLNTLFSAKSKKNLQGTMENMETISGDFSDIVSDQKQKLKNISGNIESITQNLKSNNEELSATLKNLKNISDSLAAAHLVQTLKQTNQAVKQTSEILAKINSGKGSMGLLINNDSLYKNLSASSKDLDLLLKDLKENPGRYVHFSVIGRKDKKSGEKKEKLK